MKKIDVISSFYRGKKVNFDCFIADFNAEGKAVIEIEDNEVEQLEKVFKTYPNIYKGTKLPEVKKEENSSINQANKVNNSSEFNFLKEKNIELAKENANLKKENEELKNKVTELEGYLNSNSKDIAEDIEKKNEGMDDEKEFDNTDENNEENDDLKEQLSSKTVVQLKEILNEDFVQYKEEWKGLTKKDEIVEYIISAINNNQ